MWIEQQNVCKTMMCIQNKIKAALLITFIFLLLCIAGCAKEKEKTAKIKDLEFTVLAEENIPEELLKVIQEKKENSFKLTYQDSGFLYLCRGYGEQEMGGFSITVKELYETENAVYFDTTLTGPVPKDEDVLRQKKESHSYPYLVVKLEEMEKPVVFQ